MKNPSLIMTICAMWLAFALPAAPDDFDTPEIKKWTEKVKGDDGQDRDVAYMTIDGVMVHETDPAKQPPPRVVAPGAMAGMATAPSDAIVLFDGTNLDHWTSTSGAPTKWVLTDGAMSPTRRSGPIRSKRHFGSCQLHVEFATPKNVSGSSQGRGNSGVFVLGQYEIQVLDSYENPTYPDGQAAALYGRQKPLVNASRGPGEWQSYDIIFHRPHFDGNGKVVKRATFTVLHNGVLVQDHTELSGGTGWLGPHAVTDYVPHADKGPIELQDHGNPVLFRNIWIRELDD